MNEGISSTELVGKLDAPKATVSRNLRMLGDRMSPTREGMGLIRLDHDPKDYRVRRAFMTDKGKLFLEELVEAMS